MSTTDAPDSAVWLGKEAAALARRVCMAVAVQVLVWSVMQFALALYENRTDKAGLLSVLAGGAAFVLTYLLIYPRSSDG